MFTTLDKAIAAIISGTVSVLAMFNVGIDLSPEFIGAIAAVISGIVVYFVPNKEAA